MKYEVIIIGAGPAGLSAALYSGRQGLSTLVIAKDLGGQAAKTNIMENYPGMPNVSGGFLIKKMKEQADTYGAKFIWQKVDSIKSKDETFTVKTENKKKYQAKSVILAFGKQHRPLKVPGEKELLGKGVGYCAICDMPFFKDKTIAIVGGGNSAIYSVLAAEKFAKKILLIHRRDKFRAEKARLEMVKKMEKTGQVEIITFSEVRKILGKEKVEAIEVENNQTNKTQKVKVDGVFIEIGFLINQDLIKDLVEFDETGEVIVNNQGQTKTPGFYVAGDISAKTYDQAIIAAGQGASASISAYQYLNGDQGEKI